MKKVSLRVSGSRSNPFSHLYLYIGSKEFRLRVFPYFNRYKVQTMNGESYHETRFGFTNSLPEWLGKVLQFKNDIDCYQWDTAYENGGKSPNWFVLAFYVLKSRRNMSKCKHPNMEYTSYCNADSGGEEFYCPDCGFSHSVNYY